MKMAPGQVTVVAPEKLALFVDQEPRGAKLDDGFTTVWVFYNGAASNAVLMPVVTSLPGLLTSEYPNPQPDLQADGNVRNQDGTLNDADHPAATGSTITLFTTGTGATNPPVITGSIASSTSIVPVAKLWATWQRCGLCVAPPPEPVYSLPGFLSAMFQIQVQVPNPPPAGTQFGNGVQRVGIAFFLNPPPLSPVAQPASNFVEVYVK